MLACRVFGHRWRFGAEGAVMRWECERGCGATGSKRYASGEQAEHFARAFDRDDREALGKRPTLSLLPLWLARRAARRHSGRS